MKIKVIKTVLEELNIKFTETATELNIINIYGGESNSEAICTIDKFVDESKFTISFGRKLSQKQIIHTQRIIELYNIGLYFSLFKGEYSIYGEIKNEEHLKGIINKITELNL